jgi:hypothetical protein
MIAMTEWTELHDAELRVRSHLDTGQREYFNQSRVTAMAMPAA